MIGTFGQARAASLAPGGTSRSDVLGRKYQPFSNPFFDQASTYTPPSIKSLFGFCRFFFLTHGIIHAVIMKAAEYPVTDILLQHQNPDVVKRWDNFLNGGLDYSVREIEFNLDYYAYGNALFSPSFPFRKIIVCASCNKQHEALRTRQNWRYTNHKFWLSCPKCGQSGYVKTTYDEYAKKEADINLIRWNPENVSITHNETTGRSDYVLDMSQEFKGQVSMGRKDLIATSPEIFLRAVREKRAIVFDPGSIFHMRRSSLSSMDKGWGIPLLMPALKDAYYMQIMKKAQEAVLLTHLVPQVFLFPQPATAGADPFSTVNLSQWREHIRRELARQRMDPAYYGILPFPLGHQTIGENGRSLLLMPEIQQLAEMMVVSMGFPTDLIFGNGTYASSSVSMRMLENFFLFNVRARNRGLHWLMRLVGSYMGWEVPTAKYKPFRMADDLQRQALLLQMNQMGKLTDTTLLASMDYKVTDEAKIRVGEVEFLRESRRKQQLAEAELQGEMMLTQAKYQAKAQAMSAQSQVTRQADPFAELQASPIGQQQPAMTLDAAAAALADYIKKQPAHLQASYMRQIEVQSPELQQLVQQQVQGPEGAPNPPQQDQGGQQIQAPAVDMRPMPEQLPPRRQG